MNSSTVYTKLNKYYNLDGYVLSSDAQVSSNTQVSDQLWNCIQQATVDSKTMVCGVVLGSPTMMMSMANQSTQLITTPLD
jgi:hypothetical protein